MPEFVRRKRLRRLIDNDQLQVAGAPRVPPWEWAVSEHVCAPRIGDDERIEAREVCSVGAVENLEDCYLVGTEPRAQLRSISKSRLDLKSNPVLRGDPTIPEKPREDYDGYRPELLPYESSRSWDDG